MSSTTEAKGRAFADLHRRPQPFIIANPFDAGSARILAALGFEALATTSAGIAFTSGLLDFSLGRDSAIERIRAIVEATDLPVFGRS